jgi:hypothetical protein
VIEAMTEAEWLTGADPGPMLELLRGRASDRKLRLFACACVRRVWHLLADGRSRRAVEVAERFADGEADNEDLRLAVIGAENVADALVAFSTTAGQEAQGSAAFAALNATSGARRAADYSAANAGSAAYHAATAANAPSAASVRDAERAAQSGLLREIFGNPIRPTPVVPAWLAWDGGTVLKVAEAIYHERAFDRLPILADALEEAGCTDAAMLRHCRCGGEHVRGCRVIDLLTGRT